MRCPWCGVKNLPGADHCENCGIGMSKLDLPRMLSDVGRCLLEDTVQDLHPVEPVTVPEDTNVSRAVAIMRDRNIGCVLVVDSDGRLTGILSERELLLGVDGETADLKELPVTDYMVQRPETGMENHPLAFAIQRMIVGQIRHLPVTDPEGRPVGIISSRDIVSYFAANFGG